MTPDDEDVQALTAETCEAVLGLEVRPTTEAPPPDSACLRGRVTVTGAWQGAVTVACTPSFAQAAADRIFEAPGGRASPEEVRDALGELANIIGGGVKSLMPSPSRLSMPVVTEGQGWRDAEPARPVREVWFDCSGEPLVVTVTDGDEPPPLPTARFPDP
jgi:chemotaxis protein CheX